MAKVCASDLGELLGVMLKPA